MTLDEIRKLKAAAEARIFEAVNQEWIALERLTGVRVLDVEVDLQRFAILSERSVAGRPFRIRIDMDPI